MEVSTRDARWQSRADAPDGYSAIPFAIASSSESSLARQDFAEASAAFEEAELAQLTSAIVTINAWNRIAISLGVHSGRGHAKDVNGVMA